VAKLKYKHTTSITDLDKIVQIDDHIAIESIDILSSSILGVNATYWYNIATKRINILKSIENDFAYDMQTSMKQLKNNIELKSIFNFVIFTIILIIVFLVSIKIIYNITNSITIFKQGLINFFKYLTNETKDVEPISIDSYDEFGEMTEVINTNIKKTKIYLDKKIDEQLMESQKKDKILFQQSKMVAMGEMIGNIAHQWRQPLSVISTGATGMQMQKEYGLLTDEQFNKVCNDINTNAQYLSKTIDDFRNFIKGNRKKSIFSLKQEMETFLQLVESSIKAYHIDIILDIDNDIKVDGYRNELTQCLINIFNNAKDALKENNKDQAKIVFISTSQNNRDVIIKIKDNAGGIPNDILHKIFEPYFTTKHQSQGTGLGLHMTFNLIVDGMKGIIEVHNCEYIYKKEKYIGAEFTITIPLK
jgi:signal transduction histidine kinase